MPCPSLKLSCPPFFFSKPAVPPPPKVQPIEPGKVAAWIRNVDSAFPQFNRIADHGAYSLLEKQIEILTPLLGEGQFIAKAPTDNELTARMINESVKPRLDQLQQRYTQAQKQLADHPDFKEQDAKIEKKWKELGLPPSILEDHIDCARFLFESSLIYKIIAYKATCNDPDMHDVKLDNDGHPMIKHVGEFKRWEVIREKLEYDPKTYDIRSKDCSGTLVGNWSYLHPKGLVPIDRLYNDKLEVFYKITPEERQRVVDCAHKFYDTNKEIDANIPKDWVVQFHTSPRRQFVTSIPPFSDDPINDNLVKNLNTHIVMRLVAPNGDVYSFGVEMPAESQEFLWKDGITSFLGTVTARINKTGDYEEFKPHEGRLVTSIPLTTQRAENIINMVNNPVDKNGRPSNGDIRFNFLRQNCSQLATMVLKQAGYEVPMQTTTKEFLTGILPDLKYIPYVGYPLDKINQVFQKISQGIQWITPGPIQTLFSYGKSLVFYIPGKIATVAINLLVRYLGGGTMLHALPKGVEEDEFYPATNRFLNFSHILRSWSDITSDRTLEVYHSKYFIDWQKKQNSTVLYPKSAGPAFTIVPPAP